MAYFVRRPSLLVASSFKTIHGLMGRSVTVSSAGIRTFNIITKSKCIQSPLATRNNLLNKSFCNSCWSSIARCRDARSALNPKMRCQILVRNISSGRGDTKKSHTTAVLYICAIGVGMVGMTYAGVPLYRIFCQASGLGGQPVRGHDVSKVGDMAKVEDRIIRIQFNADTASSMQWNFRPQQTEVRVAPGETALAFYTAKNPTDKPIVGISTYNVVQFEAGQYFNKIQCFCFEEQRLNPHEQVDMPVFFYIDPEFAEDPKLEGVDRIILSYTFFEAKEGFEVPVPPYLQHWRATA